MDKKIILITGGSSGIGRACCEYLASKGHIVFGTTRKEVENNEVDYFGGKITMVTLDVTKQQTIDEAVKFIILKYGRLDILINCAGFGIAGAIEDSNYQEALSQFDVNFFGVMNVTNKVLPILREQGNGQIINVGSVAGYAELPFQSMYAASKAALLSYTRALHNEVKPFNIKVSMVEPGDIHTGFTDSRVFSKKSDNDSVYKERFIKSIKVMEKDERNGSEPIVIAKAIERVIKRKTPPISTTVGFKYKVFKLLFKILPERLIQYILFVLYGK